MMRGTAEAVAIIVFVLGTWVILYRSTAPVAEAVPTTTGDAVVHGALDNRYYWGVRESTRALVRRRYKGDTTTARARAYFAHMDTAYDPTYAKPTWEAQ